MEKMGVIIVVGSSIFTFKLGYWHLILVIALIGYFWPEKKNEDKTKAYQI